MKIIVFTLRSGTKMDFDQYTGLHNPSVQDEARLGEFARFAMIGDDFIQGYEIVEREMQGAGK